MFSLDTSPSCFADPLGTISVELPPGWGYDPASSSLTCLVFGRWDRSHQAILVKVQPARVAPGESDERWLESLGRLEDAPPFADVASPRGRAVAITYVGRSGAAMHREAWVRGPRLDFMLEHRNCDPDDPHEWALLGAAVRSLDSAPNEAMPEWREEKDILASFKAGKAAYERGDTATATRALLDALRGAVGSWQYSLVAPGGYPKAGAAWRVAELLAALGNWTGHLAWLRDAEYVSRRCLRFLAEMGGTRKLTGNVSTTLGQIEEVQAKRLETRVAAGTNTVMSLLRGRSEYWVKRALDPALKDDFPPPVLHAAWACRDLLSALTLYSRGRRAEPEMIAGQVYLARHVLAAGKVLYLEAMNAQDAVAAEAASELVLEMARLNHSRTTDEGRHEHLAMALMEHAGSITSFAPDIPGLERAAALLEEATGLLDEAEVEGPLRAQLCLNDAWVRHYRKRREGSLAIIDRGLAALESHEIAEIEQSLRSLKSQFLLHEGRFDDAIIEARQALEMQTERGVTSTHHLNLAIALEAADRRAEAVESARKALRVALADRPLGEDVLRILFALAHLVEETDPTASLRLTRAAQRVLDARRLELDEPAAIAFEEAERHHEVAAELVSRLIAADDLVGALAAADEARARVLLRAFGAAPERTRTAPAAAIEVAAGGDPVRAARDAAGAVIEAAGAVLTAAGAPPPLSGSDIVDLVEGTGRHALILHVARERLVLMLVDPERRVLVGESPVPLAEVRQALATTREELGVFAVARSRSAERLPLADVGGETEELDGALELLSEAIVGPMARHLPDSGPLIVSPYRELALAPFALLPLGGGARLVDRLAVSVVPSIATLAQLQARSRRGSGRGLLIGDPALSADHALDALPAAGRELDEIAALLARRGLDLEKLMTCRGAEASERGYRTHARNAKLVHLACHARVGEPVAESALYLSPSAAGDGLLLPHEVSQVPLADALVFLAACDSGLGRATADGVIGFGRAFLEAGARTVIQSLWRVADAVSPVFAGYFYGALFAKEGAVASDEALRRAMVATRDDLAEGRVLSANGEPLDDHPAHWAPYLLLGDGGLLVAR